MMLTLPTQDLDHYQYAITVDDIAITITMDWVDGQGWFLSLDDANGNRRLAQRRITPFNPINKIFTHPMLPQGTFLVSSPTDDDLTRTSFSDDGAKLLYLSPLEASLYDIV